MLSRDGEQAAELTGVYQRDTKAEALRRFAVDAKRLRGRTRDGRMAIAVAPGDLARPDAWYVKRWPAFFR
jgi:hypothetical protein